MSSIAMTFHHNPQHSNYMINLSSSPSESTMQQQQQKQQQQQPEERTIQRKISKNESIHSGHFMVSEIEDNEAEKSNKEVSPESEHVESPGLVSNYEFQDDKYTHTYISSCMNNSVQIDSSLDKLFECMSLAYSGKITSPKWKTFKGLKLHIKVKIRLNNIIWRAWHIQYIACRNPVVCQFSSSADSKRHKRTETIILEGKYWKRRITAVIEEYKKWRMFHRKSGERQTPSKPSTSFDWENSLPRWSNNLSFDNLFSGFDSDTFSINMTNPFSNFYDHINSREIASSGMGAEFMQPGLEQLQPNVDFMDTFEPLQDYLNRVQTLPTVQEEPTFETNIREDLLTSQVYSANNEPTEPQSITGQLYQPTNHSTLLECKLNNGGNLMDPNTTQPSATAIGNQFEPMTKLNLTADYNSYPNQNDQMMPSNDLYTANCPPMQQQQQQQSTNVQVALNQLPMKQQQQNVLPLNNVFDNNKTLQHFNATSNVNPLSLGGASLRSDQNDAHSFNNTRFVPAVTSLQSTTQPQVQIQSTQESSTFSVDSNLYFMEQSMSNNKNAKNTKYPYNVQCYPITVNTSEEMTNKEALPPSTTFRSRSRSISESQDKNVSTIKNLLTRPSLVSTLTANETFTSASCRQLAGPSTSHSQMNSQLRGNMERSLSLPLYAQERHRKSSLNSQLLLQKVQLADTSQTNRGSGDHYEASNRRSGGNYSFEPTTFAFYSSNTSPSISNDSSSYSNQESLIPTMNSNNNLPPLRKISQPNMQYIPSKVTETPLGTTNERLGYGNSTVASSANLLTNLLSSSTTQRQVVQNGLFTTSSSSSSPTGSLDTSMNNNNNNNNKTLSNQLSSPPFIGSGSGSSAHSHLTSMACNNQFQVDFSKDIKSEYKKSTLFTQTKFGNTVKEKLLDTNLASNPFSAELSPSSSLTSLPRSSSRETLFKSLSNTNTLGGGLVMERVKGDSERIVSKERRRVCHINAEQKRRCNIKNGFDTLRNLLPGLNNTNSNTKISKAAMLQKAAEYIRVLKSEKYDQQKEHESLRQQVDSLNQTISVFQSQLPATGAPITNQRSSQIKQQYAEYVKSRTLQNWKFWVFSILMESLLDSYCATVATSSVDEMCKTLFRWLDQNCCLMTLRRDIINSLSFISTSTNILSTPETLSQEALLAVRKMTPKEDGDPLKKYAGL